MEGLQSTMTSMKNVKLKLMNFQLNILNLKLSGWTKNGERGPSFIQNFKCFETKNYLAISNTVFNLIRDLKSSHV